MGLAQRRGPGYHPTLGPRPRRVFLAIGRQEAFHFEAAPQHSYVIRSVDPVTPPLNLPDQEAILATGPFAEGDEATLLKSRQIDVIAAWSVDRLGRSLQHLVAFLGEIHAHRTDLYLHQQGIDTTMADIAEAAGVSRATLYRYFPNRDALVRALQEVALADLADRQPPDQVRKFRASVLELRKDPELGNKLFDRKDNVYGRMLPGYTEDTVRELREESPDEAMSGISPRLSSITMRMPSRSDSSRKSEIPFTRSSRISSAIFSMSLDLLT